MSRYVPDEDILVAVNLSPVCLQRPELPAVIGQILDRTGFPSSRLAVEVTETAIAEGDDSVVDTLAGIRRLAVGMVAIDDFGVGQSSLARLGRLPIDALKIDRQLIGEGRSDETHAIVRGIIQLGHAIDLTVIAEGVEDERTSNWLVGLSWDAMQGFQFSRPMPPDQLPAWLDTAVPASGSR